MFLYILATYLVLVKFYAMYLCVLSLANICSWFHCLNIFSTSSHCKGIDLGWYFVIFGFYFQKFDCMFSGANSMLNRLISFIVKNLSKSSPFVHFQTSDE